MMRRRAFAPYCIASFHQGSFSLRSRDAITNSTSGFEVSGPKIVFRCMRRAIASSFHHTRGWEGGTLFLGTPRRPRLEACRSLR